MEGTGVFKAIAAVQAELAKEGIGKGRKNKEQGYQFRGIDDVYNSLAPLLSENKLCILPRVLNRELHLRQTAKGTPLFNVVVEAEFDFVCAEDGSKHVVKTFGEAMDMADKATNKAMSAAYKYACLQAFCIPTEGDNDADATTPEVAHASPPAFDSPGALQGFQANFAKSLADAATVESLNDVIKLNKALSDKIRAAGHPTELNVLDDLQKQYRARLIELKKTPPAAPATVEKAMKTNTAASVLGDDEIPF